jgi:hypothetical protein
MRRRGLMLYLRNEPYAWNVQLVDNLLNVVQPVVEPIPKHREKASPQETNNQRRRDEEEWAGRAFLSQRGR